MVIIWLEFAVEKLFLQERNEFMSLKKHLNDKHFYKVALIVLAFGLAGQDAVAQNTGKPGDSTWRYRELEFLMYSEKAEETLHQAQRELTATLANVEKAFKDSGTTPLSQYQCPETLSLPLLDEHVDMNITTARLYQKYGHYFLCRRAFNEALNTLSKAIPLFQAGYGREMLMQRDDPQYIIEARRFYDKALSDVMVLIEAAGAWQAYSTAQNLTNQYWPRRTENASDMQALRVSVINAWEDAIRLLNLLGMAREEDDARARLRLILNYRTGN